MAFSEFASFLRGGEKFISISMDNYLGHRGLICTGEVRGGPVFGFCSLYAINRF